jgi:predicted MFS family arabinose efflux permease
MSGVVISEFLLRQMDNPSTVMVGTITALYDVGAVFGAILAAVTAERLGRKRALVFGSVLLIIGCVLMGAAMERIMMMFGRIFTGLGMPPPRDALCRRHANCAGPRRKASATSPPWPRSTSPRSASPSSAGGCCAVS